MSKYIPESHSLDFILTGVHKIDLGFQVTKDRINEAAKIIHKQLRRMILNQSAVREIRRSRRRRMRWH